MEPTPVNLHGFHFGIYKNGLLIRVASQCPRGLEDEVVWCQGSGVGDKAQELDAETLTLRRSMGVRRRTCQGRLVSCLLAAQFSPFHLTGFAKLAAAIGSPCHLRTRKAARSTCRVQLFGLHITWISVVFHLCPTVRQASFPAADLQREQLKPTFAQSAHQQLDIMPSCLSASGFTLLRAA